MAKRIQTFSLNGLWWIDESRVRNMFAWCIIGSDAWRENDDKSQGRRFTDYYTYNDYVPFTPLLYVHKCKTGRKRPSRNKKVLLTLVDNGNVCCLWLWLARPRSSFQRTFPFSFVRKAKSVGLLVGFLSLPLPLLYFRFWPLSSAVGVFTVRRLASLTAVRPAQPDRPTDVGWEDRLSRSRRDSSNTVSCRHHQKRLRSA